MNVAHALTSTSGDRVNSRPTCPEDFALAGNVFQLFRGFSAPERGDVPDPGPAGSGRSGPLASPLAGAKPWAQAAARLARALVSHDRARHRLARRRLARRWTAPSVAGPTFRLP